MNKRIALLAGIVSLAYPVQAETLREAVAAAYAGNPTLASAHARQDALSEETEQARAAGRLTAAADAGAGYDKFDFGKGGGATVSATLPIWTGGRVPSAVHAAQADVAAGEQNVRDSEASLITAVVGAYAELLYDQQAVGIAKADIALLDHQVAEAQARFKLGQATKTDVAQLVAQRASAVATLADAQATLDMTQASYRATVGHDPGALAPPPLTLPSLPGTLDQARSRAIAGNPQLQASLRAADASAARIDAARANGAPSLGVGAAYGYDENLGNSNVGGFPRATAVSLQLHVPILTGGLVSSQVRQANAAHRADLFDADAAMRETTRQVDSAWAALASAHAQTDADSGRVDAADLALKGVRAEYAFALRSTLEILEADESLRAAQLALARQRSDALIAATALLRATGRLDHDAF
jgi:outer membrane protein